jgi:error-prone DNA polymerase
LKHELKLIAKLGFAGYFLIVWDLIRYCQQHGILVQGRGSAANSAVCYALEITAVDPVGMELLFERFLSENRGEWPDIDLDLPSGDQREQVIQYVYERYGQLGAAMTANVISYRGRSAAREVGKALGFEGRPARAPLQPGRPLGVARRKRHHGPPLRPGRLRYSPSRIARYLDLCMRMQDLPRHLGQHSGGMVICAGMLNRVVPIERASMPGRTVIQWDKEDCADMGLIKVDLLGLGMMAVLKDCIELIPRHYKKEVDLAALPEDPLVYERSARPTRWACSRWKAARRWPPSRTTRPPRFYDLVVQVAIIRPGPIVGKMMHPYMRRRQGKEEVTYPHPSLEPVLKRTLGVPLFQEQLLRMAMVVASFTGAEAEELRRAVGMRRSMQRMKDLEGRLRDGMTRNGIGPEAQDNIVQGISSFAMYGFPESHAASFALIAYASAYLKVHYLAAFTCGLLNNQPMGFYSPAVLIKDAQRHGLRVRPIACSVPKALHAGSRTRRADAGSLAPYWLQLCQRPAAASHVNRCRLAARNQHGEFAPSTTWLCASRTQPQGTRRPGPRRRAQLTRRVEHRRDALWQVEQAGRPVGPLLRSAAPTDTATNPLQQMTADERIAADYAGTGVTTGPHPMAWQRATSKAGFSLSKRSGRMRHRAQSPHRRPRHLPPAPRHRQGLRLSLARRRNRHRQHHRRA